MSNIQQVLFYSQITLAMNAARIFKALAMEREYNRTERELITFAQASMIINSAKMWDATGYNVEKFIKRSGASDSERQNLLDEILVIKTSHAATILTVRKWRNKLVAHLDDGLTTSEKFNEFDGDVADIQRMLQEVADLVSSASWYPAKNRPMKFLDYDQIEGDLRL